MNEPNTLLHAAVVLLLCSTLPVLHAARPIIPDAVGQCTTPGGCAADDARTRGEQLREQLKAKLGAGSDGDDDEDVGSGENAEISESRSPDTSELAELLADYFGTGAVTSAMQKHVERSLFVKKFPEGAQDAEYVNFGSLLDISTISSSTWSGSTDFGGKSPWISSLLNRESLIGESKPCKVSSFHPDEDDDSSCLIGATVQNFVKISGTEEVKKEEMALAAEFGILGKGKGSFMAGNVMTMDFALKFDTVVANGVLAAVDIDLDEHALPMEDMDLVLEKLISLLKPGGTLWLIGTEPLSTVDGPEGVGMEVMHMLESVKSLSGEYPKRNLSAKWIGRNLARLRCPVFSSTLFPVKYEFDDMVKTIEETREWVDELDHSDDIKRSYYAMLGGLESYVEEVTTDGPIFAGEHTYIIGAECPLTTTESQK